MKASVRLEHQLLAIESEHRVHAMLEIESPAAPEQANRPPLHLALVLDRSGSMAGPKLEVTKECAAFLVRRLAPTDEVALVAYDDHVSLIAPLARVNQDALKHAIGSINPGGSTNLSGGWLKGMEEAKRGAGDGVRKVLLLTDGLANVGITDPPRLVGMATNARGAGVGTTTIGFGDRFNEQLLTSMADAGGGKSYYAAGPEEAPGIFAEEFEGLMSLVAQNVSVEIRPSSDVRVFGVLNEYPIVDVPGGLQVDLGDAYGEERRRVVFQLLIPELTRLGVAKVADVVLRYVSVGEETAHHEVTIPLNVNLVSADEAAEAEPDAQVREEVIVLGTAKAQKDARDRADRGDFESAKRLMTSSIKQLEEWLPHSSRAQELRSELQQLKANESMMDRASWSPAASKRSHFQSHRMQRSRRPRNWGGGHSSRGGSSAGDTSALERLLECARTPPRARGYWRTIGSRENAYRGVMLGIAAGSSLGLGIEGWSRSLITDRFPNGITDIPDSERHALWDDDVAQTVLLAEAMVAGDRLDPDDLARRLLKWSRENGRGMGFLTTQVLSELERGVPATEAARLVWEAEGRSSAGNGAIMRCAPVALRWPNDPRQLIEDARVSAEVTHFDPRCVWSTVALDVALAMSLVERDIDLAALAPAVAAAGAPVEVAEAIRSVEAATLDDFELDDPASMGYTLKTLQVGLWSLGQPDDFEATLIEVVSAGGDTDTNGAVAGAVMGSRVGVGSIPDRWLKNLHARGRLTTLADELLQVASS